jgi:hypothetical protein
VVEVELAAMDLEARRQPIRSIPLMAPFVRENHDHNRPQQLVPTMPKVLIDASIDDGNEAT